MTRSDSLSRKALVLLSNLLMVSLVLLPSFFASLIIELTLQGESLTRPSISYQAAAVLVDYISLWLEMAPASLVHSIVMIFLPLPAAPWAKKAVGYVASSVVPGIPMLLDSGTAFYLSAYWACTVIATLVYAYASTSVFMKYSMVVGAPETARLD